MKDLVEVLAADPNFTEAHFYLGVALEAQGNKDKAKSEFCTAFKQGFALAKSRCEAEP